MAEVVHFYAVGGVVGHPGMAVDAILEVVVAWGDGGVGDPPSFAGVGERDGVSEPAGEGAEDFDGGGVGREDLELEFAGWECGDHASIFH